MPFLFVILTIGFGLVTLFMILRRRYGVAVLSGYLCAMGVTLLLLGEDSQGYRAPVAEDEHAQSRPQEENFDGYVTSDTCQSCHPGAYHSWHGSYHRKMTQVATPESVLGDFDDNVFAVDGAEFHLERRGDEFWVRILPPVEEGKPREFVDRRVVMTTGSHHYQAYWLDGHYTEPESPEDRMVWVLPFIYVLGDEKREARWLPRTVAFLMPPEHMEGNALKAGPWNSNCVKCHTTHGVEQLAANSGTGTRAAEFGIACEACHGPGEEHVRKNRDPVRRYRLRDGESFDSTIVNPAKLDRYRSSQVCGRCHMVIGPFKAASLEDYQKNGFGFRPGENLHDSILRTRFDDFMSNKDMAIELEGKPMYLKNLFWSDGMIRVVGREYNGLLETPCFQRGEMSCLSCHELHKKDADTRSMDVWAADQLKPGMRTDAACIQCHENFQDKTMIVAHTHHLAGSSGSECMNCHMPHTTYGLHKAVRSHQVDSPSVAASLQTGRPNACNQCHLDKTMGWAASALEEWYGIPAPDLNDDEKNIAASVLWAVKGDAGVRALMAWSFGWEEARAVSGNDWAPRYLVHLLGDHYPTNRIVARKALDEYTGFESLPRFPFPADIRDRGNAILDRFLRVGAPGTARPGLLLDAEGRIDESEFQRILKERDNTPVMLSE